MARRNTIGTKVNEATPAVLTEFIAVANAKDIHASRISVWVYGDGQAVDVEVRQTLGTRTGVITGKTGTTVAGEWFVLTFTDITVGDIELVATTLAAAPTNLFAAIVALEKE